MSTVRSTACCRKAGVDRMTRSRFIDEEVKVHFEYKPGLPSAFFWHGQEYRIEEILEMERRLDFRRAWWQRRHRDYYTVRVHTGQIFKLYFHRGPGRRHWVLYSEEEEEGDGVFESPKH